MKKLIVLLSCLIMLFGMSLVFGDDGDLIVLPGDTGITTVGTIATGAWEATDVGHEAGGLGADVSGYTGLVAISGGTTSEVNSLAELQAQITDMTAAGSALLDDATIAAQRTTLGLDGTSSALTSGAYLVGVYGELTFSSAANIQDALAYLAYEIANPTTHSEVKTGRVRFNGTTGRAVVFVKPPMDDTDYDVITTNFTQAVNAGEISIEDKTTTGFTLKNSGSNVLNSFEYMAVPYTLRGSTQQQGTDTFNSTAGVTVSLSPNLDDTDYDVIISLPSQALIADIGVISVESKAVNQFVVKNSGADTVTTFNWLAVPYDLGGETDWSGTENFNTPTGVTVTIGGDVGSVAYVVLITCTSQTNIIDVGVVSIESKSQTDFVVKNSGAGTSEFEWRVFPQLAGAADMYRTVYDIDLGGHIDLEAGGLNANIGSYTGLLAVSGGVTSEVDSVAELGTQIADLEAGLEGILDLQDLQGAVTDGQVPDNITIDLAATIQVTTETIDATCYVGFFKNAVGALQPKTHIGLTFNSTIGKLTALGGFIGDVTGNVTGNVIGNVTGALYGNANYAHALVTTRTIGGVFFNGTANIVPQTIQVADTTDTTSYVALFPDASGSLYPKTDGALTYNAGTGKLTATGGFTDGTASMVSGQLTAIVALTFTGVDGVPTAPGMIGYDNVISGMSGGGLRWRDNNSDRLIVDLEDDPVDGISQDEYVVAYSAADDGFYLKEDAEGGVGTTYTDGSGIGLTGTTFFVHNGAGLLQEADGLKIGAGLVVNSMLAVNSVNASKIAANSVGSSELKSTGMVAQGTYICVSNITVDADGRITAITIGQ